MTLSVTKYHVIIALLHRLCKMGQLVNLKHFVTPDKVVNHC